MLEYDSFENGGSRIWDFGNQRPVLLLREESLYSKTSPPIEVSSRVITIAQSSGDGDDALIDVVAQCDEDMYYLGRVVDSRVDKRRRRWLDFCRWFWEVIFGPWGTSG